jgi:DNA polymerase
MYGGCWFENIVQATARDLLVHSIKACEGAGFPVVLHVHDEILCEVPKGEDFDTFLWNVKSKPAWAGGIPVAAAGWRGRRYRKG